MKERGKGIIEDRGVRKNWQKETKEIMNEKGRHEKRRRMKYVDNSTFDKSSGCGLLGCDAV
jgi:hypothetical protein